MAALYKGKVAGHRTTSARFPALAEHEPVIALIDRKNSMAAASAPGSRRRGRTRRGVALDRNRRVAGRANGSAELRHVGAGRLDLHTMGCEIDLRLGPRVRSFDRLRDGADAVAADHVVHLKGNHGFNPQGMGYGFILSTLPSLEGQAATLRDPFSL
jgi:hypothetical protein